MANCIPEFSFAAKFPLGQIVATPGALEVLAKASQGADQFIDRHVRGDWGNVDEEDSQANAEAVALGSRVLSSYRTLLGDAIWVITEADRSSTCVLTPDDY